MKLPKALVKRLLRKALRGNAKAFKKLAKSKK